MGFLNPIGNGVFLIMIILYRKIIFALAFFPNKKALQVLATGLFIVT
jgi:hypothetical protein